MPFAIGHGGARIHYEVLGEHGPWVVLIQGLALSSRFWFDAPRLLAEDPEQAHRVIVLDNRGTGQSDKPRGPYRMAHMAEDVAAVIDAAGAAPAIVVGISMGGMIAQEVALRHSERVSGLVLLATWAGLPHVRLPHPRALAKLVSLPFLGKRAGHALTGLLLAAAHRPRAHELLREWPDAMRAEPANPWIFFAQLAAAAMHSAGFRLGKIDCPTVIVCGDEDLIMRKGNGEILARKIPNAHLELLEGAAHGIPITDERAIGRAITKVRAMR